MSCTLTLQRRKLYYALTICVRILILSFLNYLVYVLPPDLGEKFLFSLTVLLAYMVNIRFLIDNLPWTSKNHVVFERISQLNDFFKFPVCF